MGLNRPKVGARPVINSGTSEAPVLSHWQEDVLPPSGSKPSPPTLHSGDTSVHGIST